MNDYELFDKINTTAANWLRLYAKKTNMPLGIRKFDGKNNYHIWLLKIIDIASIANSYQDYWIGCSWIDWIKFRFFKHFKHMKKLKKNYNGHNDNIAFIDISIFIDEICEACNVKPINIESMFEGYWKI